MTVHPLTAPLNEALERANLSRPGGTPLNKFDIAEVVTVRVSSPTAEKLDQHRRQGEQLYADHQVVGPWLASLPDGALTNEVTDLERASFGLVRVEARHAHPQSTSTRCLGYAAVVVSEDNEAALFLSIAHTAAQYDLVTDTGDANSWSEIFAAAFEWAERALMARFPSADRMTRTAGVLVRIANVIKARPGAMLSIGDRELDPHRDEFVMTVESGLAAGEVAAMKVRQLAGRLDRFKNRQWPRGWLPVGLEREQLRDSRGQVISSTKQTLVRDQESLALVAKAFAQYAQGTSTTGIAVDAAIAGARDGGGALLLPKLVAIVPVERREDAKAAIDSLEQDGKIDSSEKADALAFLAADSDDKATAAQVATHFMERLLRGRFHLRTGRLYVVEFGSIEGRTSYQGWTPEFLRPGDIEGDSADKLKAEFPVGHPFWAGDLEAKSKYVTHGYWTFMYDFEKPFIDLTDAQWNEIERRFAHARLAKIKKPGPMQRRPMSGLAWTTASGDQVRFAQGGDAQTYTVELNPGTSSREHLHTLRATSVHRELSKKLLDFAEHVENGQPVDKAGHGTVDLASDVRLTELENSLEELGQEIEGLVLFAAKLEVSEPESESLVRTNALRQACEVERAEQLSAISTLRSAAASPGHGQREVEIDLAPIIATALALSQADPYAPSIVTDATRKLLGDGRGLSNLRQGQHERQLLVDSSIAVELTDGTTGWMQLGVLDFTDHRVTPTRRAEHNDDLARRFLRDGESVADLCERFGCQPQDVLQRATQVLGHWNTSCYLRSAIVNAAAAGNTGIPVGAWAYAQATGNTKIVKDLRSVYGDTIIDAIQMAYEPSVSWAHATGWVRMPLKPWRQLMTATAARSKLRIAALPGMIDGINTEQLLKDRLVAGRTPHWQPPLQLIDGWVHPYRCQNSRCPGGVGNPLTGFLPVPELLAINSAVFCTSCFHALDGKIVVPDAYRLQFDVTTKQASNRTANAIPVIIESGQPPSLGSTPMRSRDVAKLHDVPRHVVYKAAGDGLIPATRDSSNHFVFSEDLVDNEAVRDVLQSHTRSGPTATTYGLREAATRLGVRLSFLRTIVAWDALTRSTSSPARYDCDEVEELIDHVRARMGDQTATMRDLSTAHDLGQKFGISAAGVKNMARHHVFEAVSIGNSAMFTNRSVEALDPRILAALDPKQQMTTPEVAKLAGLKNSSLDYYIRLGKLNTVQIAPGCERRFIRSEVEQWLRTREADN